MRMISALIPLVALLGLTACETVQGAGRDMQKAGSAITQEAQRAEQKM
ncbi:entericidin A/B family lipoprotein [Gemmobacter serpentinus]|nr:entericidin A/B family lipoprotein [Gemmobacter serpentinus]